MISNSNKTRILAAALLVLALPSDWLFSQTPVNGGGGHFRMAIASFDMSGVSGVLPATYPKLSYGFRGFGGAGYALINNFIVGGEGMGYPGVRSSDATVSITPVVAYGLFNCGYVVFRRNRLLVYPLLGIGAGSLIIDIEERLGSNGSSSEKFERRQISTQQAAISIAAGADQYLMFGSGDGGISISLRVGISYGFQTGTWKGQVDSGKLVKFPGAFISLGFGGGGWSDN